MSSLGKGADHTRSRSSPGLFPSTSRRRWHRHFECFLLLFKFTSTAGTLSTVTVLRVSPFNTLRSLCSLTVVRVQQLSLLPSSFQSRQTLFSAQDSFILFLSSCPISTPHDFWYCNWIQPTRLLASSSSKHPRATIMTHLSATIATLVAVFTKAVLTFTLTPPANLNLGEASKSRMRSCAMSWLRADGVPQHLSRAWPRPSQKVLCRTTPAMRR